MITPDINPAMLKFARECMELDIEEAARKLGIKDTKKQKASEKLQAIELGKVDITRSVLIKAINCYKRSLIYFYLDSPPREDKVGIDFRTTSTEFKDKKNEALLKALVRDIKLRQSMVCNILQDEETEPFSLKCSVDINSDTKNVAALITQLFNIDLREYRKTKDAMTAFKYLRNKIEDAGIFVLLMGDLGSHHTNIYPQTFRGIASSDIFAPFIVINKHDSKSAWSFTLLHELTHLLINEPGISNNDDTHKPQNRVERFCNDVAAEILFPSSELTSLYASHNEEELLNLISDISSEKKLSKGMIAYNLYKHGKIDSSLWKAIQEKLKPTCDENYKVKQDKGKTGGPNYYTIKRNSIGKALFNLTKRAVYSGELQPTKAAIVLGVSPLSVYTMINENA
jgi:Zn-dependent peptidase ImmA (M78 family)